MGTLSPLNLSSVVTSPMKRCQETAIPFARSLNVTPVVNTGVTEIPTPDGLDDRVGWLRNFMAGTWDEAPDLLTDWKDKLIETLEALPDNTAVFSHFVAINAICSHLENVPDVRVFSPGHCSVTLLERAPTGLVVAQRGSEAATKVL